MPKERPPIQVWHKYLRDLLFMIYVLVASNGPRIPAEYLTLLVPGGQNVEGLHTAGDRRRTAWSDGAERILFMKKHPLGFMFILPEKQMQHTPPYVNPL